MQYPGFIYTKKSAVHLSDRRGVNVCKIREMRNLTIYFPSHLVAPSNFMANSADPAASDVRLHYLPNPLRET